MESNKTERRRTKMKSCLLVACTLCLLAAGLASESPSQTPAAGLAVGQKAPDFSSMDQFGNQQSLESLKGSGGTVLLFFRSADW
jgi:cytochrome oxidase Cu insertion factor (SCO1/SenC/PrrC family)